LQPIRTAAEINAHIKILPAQQLPLYQKLAQKATELHLLGMSYRQIARSLNVGKNTVIKACRFQKRIMDDSRR
jgi:DNA invertase Pin-like site-specific DNA recombinase